VIPMFFHSQLHVRFILSLTMVATMIDNVSATSLDNMLTDGIVDDRRFDADDRWQTIRIPFASLKPYKTTQKFSPEELIRIGVVAISRNFKADLCLASLRFYR